MKVRLPIDTHLSEIVSRLKDSTGLVLTAEPGAGKTTRLPPALCDIFSGQILVLQPRRMAAAAAATRVAEESNWKLSDKVGYQVRFDNKTSEKTQLVYLTEALLTRRLINDPELKGVSAVILDEFHERSIHVDLALGFLREMQLLGSSIKIVVMSATLDAAPIAEFLGKVHIVQVPGQLFPLTVEYQNANQRLKTDFEFYKLLKTAVQRTLQASNKDVLVFLPGTGEIRRACEELESLETLARFERLHGSLTLQEQQQVLKKAPGRRIIFSTNIAESSLTLDGVGAVVDSGLARVIRQSARSSFSRLEVNRISKASADQRAGRAARQWPGFCFRMWTKMENSTLNAHETPEILRADLSETLLFLSQTGISNFLQFHWFESPLPQQINRATSELKSLEALDKNNQITPLGRELLKWPLTPRLAKLMVAGTRTSQSRLASDICAILSERDFIPAKALAAYGADRWECDLALRLNLLRDFRAQNADRDLDRASLRSIIKLSDQLSPAKPLDMDIDRENIRKLLFFAFGDRLSRRRPNSDRGLMLGGRGVKLNSDSMVKNSPFFLALDGMDLEGSADTLVNVASGMEKSELYSVLDRGKINERTTCHFDKETRRFVEVKEKIYRDLVLEQSQPHAAKPEAVRESLGDILIENLDWLKEKNADLQRWNNRWQYFLSQHPEVPELTVEEMKAALLSTAGSKVDLEKIGELDLASAFDGILDYKVRQQFNSLVPARLQVPTGTWITVEYPHGQQPYMSVRLQELFGLKSSPSIMNGRVRLVLHLLAPNFRPVQQTADLESFWREGYFEVRKELRARYPKHSWPEDPLTAPPQAKGRHRNPT